MTMKPKSKNRKLAERIARDLFTDDKDGQANRLLCQHIINGKEMVLSAWAIGPMTDRIESLLEKGTK